MRAFLRLPVRVVGAADQDQRQQQFAVECNVPFYENYKELLPLTDAVAVVAPTNRHYNIVKDALSAGNHVFVEKPMTDSMEKTKELVELARAKNLVLSVGYLHRFNPAVMKIKEILSSIGPLQYIAMRFIHSSNPPRKDSGAIFNLGIHAIDALNTILPERPRRVSCSRANLIHPEREDSAHILLDYGSFFATIEVSSCHPEKKRDMWIIAEKEKVYADLLAQTVVRYPLTISEERVDAGPIREEIIQKIEPLHEELKYFVEQVMRRNQPDQPRLINKSEEDYATIRVCELALQSASLRHDQLFTLL